MDTTTALTLRLLLLFATATLGSCLGDQCSVVHYLAAGEVRDFPFRSGSQFVDKLHCIFSFSAPSYCQLTVAVSDLNMAPPSVGSNGKPSCVDDVLTIYDLTKGKLQDIGSYCGNNATLNPQFVLSSNIAVVSFFSNESSTPRRFTLTLKAVQQINQVQQNGLTSEGQEEVETVTEEGKGNGEEEGAGEDETVTETEEGEEETVTETGEGEEETVTETGEDEGEEENEEEEEEEIQDEEGTDKNLRRGKAVPKISGVIPGGGSANSSLQHKTTKKLRRQQEAIRLQDGRQKPQNVTDKSRKKKLTEKKHQILQEKMSAVGAHRGHNRARQEDKAGWRLQLQHRTLQPFGVGTKSDRQPRLQQRRHTVQPLQRGHTVQPIRNNTNRKMKHTLVQQV